MIQSVKKTRSRGLERRHVLTGLGASLGAGMLSAGGLRSPVALGLEARSRAASFVMDARTGESLYRDQDRAARHPAALVQIMSLYMLFDALARGQIMLAEDIFVSERAASGPPFRLGLQAGEAFPARKIARSLMECSANDVAVALAERLGGNQARFCAWMNARARVLGLRQSHFTNATGLPSPGQVSTAYDLALLGQAIWRDHARFFAYSGEQEFTWSGRSCTENTDIFQRVTGVVAAKTGQSLRAGHHVMVWVESGGRRLIGLVLGGRSAQTRDALMGALLSKALEGKKGG